MRHKGRREDKEPPARLITAIQTALEKGEPRGKTHLIRPKCEGGESKKRDRKGRLMIIRNPWRKRKNWRLDQKENPSFDGSGKGS